MTFSEAKEILKWELKGNKAKLAIKLMRADAMQRDVALEEDRWNQEKYDLGPPEPRLVRTSKVLGKRKPAA